MEDLKKSFKDIEKKVTSTVGTVSKNMTENAAEAGKAFSQSAAGLFKGGGDAVKKLIQDASSGKVTKDTRNELFQKICALIPNKVDNRTVVNALDLLRMGQKTVVKKDFSSHEGKNVTAFGKHIEAIKKNNGYVEDQNSYTDMAYGDATMQFSGCEIFATFNAIRNITGKAGNNLSQMITSYERDGMVLSGKFGTAPKAISDFLKKLGYKTELTTDESQFDDVGKRNESVILTMYNDKDDISKEVHTINISKDAGKYTAHNTYCNGKVVGPFGSVSEVIAHINGGKAKGISLIGVSRK